MAAATLRLLGGQQAQGGQTQKMLKISTSDKKILLKKLLSAAQVDYKLPVANINPFTLMIRNLS